MIFEPFFVAIVASELADLANRYGLIALAVLGVLYATVLLIMVLLEALRCDSRRAHRPPRRDYSTAATEPKRPTSSRGDCMAQAHLVPSHPSHPMPA